MRCTGGGTFLVLLFLLLLPAAVSASSLLVSWKGNTESDLAGYKLYCGTEPGRYGSPITLGKVTNCQLSAVTAGKTYYIALTAYDTSGNESSFSTEVSAYIPASQAAAVITLISPTSGAVLSSTPKFSWSGSGFDSYKLYASPGGKSYSLIHSGSETSCTLSSLFWSLFVPSGSTVYWYVKGTTSDNQVVTSQISSFKKQ
jgi:hypothetical protein